MTVAAGNLHKLELIGEDGLTYYMYVPSKGGLRAPLLVSVHGLSRNAKDLAEKFIPWAEEYGVVVLAPLYSREKHGDYNFLGQSGKFSRSDRVLLRLVDEAGRLSGADTEQLYLFGYSAGGQFVHRFAFAYPERVRRVVVGAAGSYTFPDPAVSFPFGLAPIEELLDLRMEAAKFLRIPFLVLVGAEDTERGASLPKTPEIDAQQGFNRVERGRNWVEAMRRAAIEQGIAPGGEVGSSEAESYRFGLAPDSAHSFVQCVAAGGIGPVVFDFLFGAGEAKGR
jgi:pimeloyl-ACP methyl ester carboxylesterase